MKSEIPQQFPKSGCGIDPWAVTYERAQWRKRQSGSKGLHLARMQVQDGRHSRLVQLFNGAADKLFGKESETPSPAGRQVTDRRRCDHGRQFEDRSGAASDCKRLPRTVPVAD